MSLDELQEHIRAIPEENRERFQQAVMHQLPVLVSLIDSCWDTVAELYWHYVVPSDEDLMESLDYEEDDLHWTPMVGGVLDDCLVVEGLLLSMFKDVGVPTRRVDGVDDTPSLFS